MMIMSAEHEWRHLSFRDEHDFELLEENKQTFSMNMLMSYIGAESVGKSHCLTVVHRQLLWD